MRAAFIILNILFLLVGMTASAQEAEHVRISVEKFEQLLQAAQAKPTPTPVPEALPPIDFSLSTATYQVTVQEKFARIKCVVEMTILSKEWVKIPLVTSDTALAQVQLDRKSTTLHREGNRYWLHLKAPGQHQLEINYSAPVERLIGGYRLQFSTPTTVSGMMKVSLPGQWWATHVMPSEGITVTQQGGSTNIESVLVSSDRVQVLWGEQKQDQYSFTSGLYTVKVEEKGVFVGVSYRLEVDSDQPIKVPIVFNKYGLLSLTVDGKEPAIVPVGEMFGVVLQGHRTHTIKAEFAANIDRTDGQPSLQLRIPQSPITRFTFIVPGKRTVSVTPIVPVKAQTNDKLTTITVNFPKTELVKFLWSDSRPVPEQMVRMNGEGYYAVQAEEGVLRINASFIFDIISGKTREIGLNLPDNVVVYQVVGDGITDWRTFTKDKDKKRFLTVYFDQLRHGQYKLLVTYDMLVAKADRQREKDITIPLIQPQPVHRYQGTVLLLSGELLEFVPQTVEGFIPVGAEVIPAEIKTKLKHKVAYGYKYVGTPAPLIVQLEPPQKEQAKFDATVNTLQTIEEGILKARSSIDVTVKSGILKEIIFIFNPETTILDLVSPSLLKFTDTQKEGSKWVTVQFTQAMEGSFRIDIAFETLLDPKLTSIQLQPIKTLKAEVERGYIGVESVSTVEVVTEKFEDIQEIDTKELPLWLTERTNRPILLAYKYSHLPYGLVIKITRHETVPTMEARITTAVSQTSYQKDGNALTEITYTIVNHTKQFLRIEMPKQASLWQAAIGGSAVKTARDKDNRLILPLPRSKEPISCFIKYSQKHKEMGFLGKLKIHIPKTDLYTSHLRWSLQLPPDYSYFLTRSNMDYETTGQNIFSLQKTLSTVDDEVLYFKTNYRLETVRFLLISLTIFLTLILAWLYTRRSKHPSMTEKIVAASILLVFILLIFFLRLPLLIVAVTIVTLAVVSYLFSSAKETHKN
ncbi:hypothetical protein ACFL27_11935 [candidate division CSSED10-310 bacterium]|uniref:Uncharacterized protein n=1 Tax=candidate division CSSED10-310 bacterium TaxID=2855610 RepID=A0ABV6YXH3_UNCC1